MLVYKRVLTFDILLSKPPFHPGAVRWRARKAREKSQGLSGALVELVATNDQQPPNGHVTNG